MATDKIKVFFKVDGARKMMEQVYRVQMALEAIKKFEHPRKHILRHKDNRYRLRKRKINEARARLHVNAFFTLVDAAIALSAPIPRYSAFGETHPGGPEIVGENGPETIKQEDCIFPVFTPNMIDLPRGTSVLPVAHFKAI